MSENFLENPNGEVTRRPGLVGIDDYLTKDIHPDFTRIMSKVLRSRTDDDAFADVAEDINNLLHELSPSRVITTLADRLRIVAASELRPHGRGQIPGNRVASGCYFDDPKEVGDAELRRVVAQVRNQISPEATVYTVTPRVDWVPMRQAWLLSLVAEVNPDDVVISIGPHENIPAFSAGEVQS